MVRYFLIYAEADQAEAKKAHAVLRESGLHGDCGVAAEPSALKDATVLLIYLSQSAILEEKGVRRAWEWFDNEIRWNRKPHGEILFLAADAQAAEKRPVRLRKYGYFLLDELKDTAEYCRGLDETIAARKEEKEAVPSVKQIVYTPPEETVKQIEFSVRAPSVPSFDGEKKKESTAHTDRHEGICLDDHVFDARKDEEKKPKKGGFAACFIVLVVAIMVTLFIAFCVTAMMRGMDGQSGTRILGTLRFALQALRPRAIL